VPQCPIAGDANGVDPGKKVRGDNKMLYCTSMYTVHEYQKSTAGAIIESNFGGTTMFCSFPLFDLIQYILSHALLYDPFSVAKSWGLANAVSSPPSGSERSPAAKTVII